MDDRIQIVLFMVVFVIAAIVMGNNVIGQLMLDPNHVNHWMVGGSTTNAEDAFGMIFFIGAIILFCVITGIEELKE